MASRSVKFWFFFSLAFPIFCGAMATAEICQLPAPYSEVRELYDFDSFGWFNEQKQRVVKRLIEKSKAKVVIELGSFLGKSTRFIARQLPQEGKVYAVDHWKGNLEHRNPQRADVYPKLENLYERFLSNIIHANLCDRVIPIKATTLEAVEIIKGQADLIFIDASHECEDVLNDLVAWYPRVGQDGILCGDDWLWGQDLPVQRAVAHFASERGLKYFSEGAIWWIYKSVTP